MKFNELVGDCTNFEVQPATIHFVPHIVNTAGIAKSGVVIPIYNKWKNARTSYEEWYRTGICTEESPEFLTSYNRSFQLGNLQLVKGDNQIYIVNMLCQKDFGGWNMPAGRMEAIDECLYKLRETFVRVNNKGNKVQVESPKFGSMRSGLRWDLIFEKIRLVFDDIDGTWNTYSYEE